MLMNLKMEYSFIFKDEYFIFCFRPFVIMVSAMLEISLVSFFDVILLFLINLFFDSKIIVIYLFKSEIEQLSLPKKL